MPGYLDWAPSPFYPDENIHGNKKAQKSGISNYLIWDLFIYLFILYLK